MTKMMLLLIVALVTPLAVHGQGTRQTEAEIIIPNEQWRTGAYERWHYAPAVRIEDRLFVSGVVAGPIDGDMKAGFAQAWESIDTIIKAAGGTGLDDVVEFTSFHVDILSQIEAFGEVKDRYIKEPYPAWTAIGISSLAVPGPIVEIRVTAILSGK